MSNALKDFARSENRARTETPVYRRTPGRTDEVLNNTGGFVFEVSDKTRLERFLILGTDGGTYYVNQNKLTKQNVAFVRKMIKSNERLVVDTVVDVSVNNRAAKQSPAIFVMALVMTEGVDKEYAREAVQKVVRTSTHLFEYAQYLKDLGGWGRAKRRSVAEWYTSKDADSLAYQAVKYRQRDGWTHRDLFRLSHPTGVDQSVGGFILGKETDLEVRPEILDGFAVMQKAGTVNEVVRILTQYKNLPWETIPTQFLKEPQVWKTLFYNGALGQTALLRNVTRFAKIGAFDDAKFAGDVAIALADKDRIVKGRVHPVQYANAYGIYKDGQITSAGSWYGYGSRSQDWTVNAKVLGALEAGFYAAFQTVEPAGKATMISVDVSGSMTWGAPAGLVGMEYLDAAAVMAMVAVRTEPYVMVNAFSSDLREVNVSDADSLETVMAKFRNVAMGSTNIGAPIAKATRDKLQVETFQVYTDNEVNSGQKPASLIKKYRQTSGIDARYAVVGLASTGFTVADPKDTGMMDFVGFDSAAPRVMADFSAGRL